MHDLAERHLQKPGAEPLERGDVAGALEAIRALAGARVQQPARGQRPLDAAHDAGTRGHERDAAAEHPLQHRRDQRIVGAAEDHRVDLGGAQRRAVAADGVDDLLVKREPGLDHRHEVRTGDALEQHVGISRADRALVGARADRRRRRQQPEPPAAAGGDGQLRRGRQHADHVDVTPGPPQMRLQLGQRRRGRRVARHDQELGALVEQMLGDLDRERLELRRARLPYGSRAVSPRYR